MTEEIVAALIDVPFEQLSSRALRGVIESFVLREGTEYGAEDFSLEQKVSHVVRQLQEGDVTIVFDAKEETFDIRRKVPK